MTTHSTSHEIRQFIIDNVEAHPSDIGQFTAERFGITRQAVSRHLNALTKGGELKSSGNGKAKRWDLKDVQLLSHQYALEGLEEDIVWRNDVKPKLAELPQNVLTICNYGFTEMVNNAIDHSGSDAVHIVVRANAKTVTMTVTDSGVGIFKKIRDAFNLPDELTAVQELAKGKLTTDHERHSGEGVFFTSRAFDKFAIKSGDLFYSHERSQNDWLLEDVDNRIDGTVVVMQIGRKSDATLTSIFNEFSSQEHGFNRTYFPVALMQYGNDNLVSRSQAKRILSRVQQFEGIVLDFKGVETVGQAFADEIFRVFVLAHPEIEILPVNTNDAVKAMIVRAKAAMLTLNIPPSDLTQDEEKNG